METAEKAVRLAGEVMRLARDTLLVNLRFLAGAVFSLEPVPDAGDSLSTDGRAIRYGARRVLRVYADEETAVARDCLHMVLHCVFRHPFPGPGRDSALWDLACDAAVENVISELALSQVSCAREAAQERLICDLKAGAGRLTAEKIYGFLQSRGLTDAQLADLRKDFFADDHSGWYSEEEPASGKQDGGKQDGGNAGAGSAGSGETGRGGMTESGGAAGTNRDALQKKWEALGRSIQVDLETASGNWGAKSESMTQELRALNRERYDYADFLRRFAVYTETMRLSDEDFDYIYYTYGLSLYGRMPLIEPLEYRQAKQIREFVVAIDTSGSVEGETVQAFVARTYEILKQSEVFGETINLRIIQCDDEIRQSVTVTSQRELDAYIDSMQIHGLGGTDFRPVFSHVDELIRKGELTELKGMIYFTDGYGTFPEEKPPYDVAFVFLDSGENNPEVPVWAIKLVLTRDEVLCVGAGRETQ